MLRTVTAAGLLAGLVGMTAARPPADPGPEADARELQGKWERVATSEPGAAGLAPRAVKEVAGDRETVTWYGPDGGVVRSHRVTFQLSAAGPVKVFTFSAPEVLAGPGKGTKLTNTGSYVYVLDRGEFTEVGGVLAGERYSRGVPYLARWKKVPSAGAASKPAAVDGDLKLAQGTWGFASQHGGGEAVPADLLKPLTVVIAGDRFEVRAAGEVLEAGTVTLDATRSPKTLDVTVTEGRGRGDKWLGIYKLDGDTFTACLDPTGKARPTAFTTAVGSPVFLNVHTRKK